MGYPSISLKETDVVVDQDNPFNSVIKDGGVTIKFGETIGGKVILYFTIDFSKTSLSAHEAAQVMGKVVNLLRRELNVALNEVKL